MSLYHHCPPISARSRARNPPSSILAQECDDLSDIFDRTNTWCGRGLVHILLALFHRFGGHSTRAMLSIILANPREIGIYLLPHFCPNRSWIHTIHSNIILVSKLEGPCLGDILKTRFRGTVYGMHFPSCRQISN